MLPTNDTFVKTWGGGLQRMKSYISRAMSWPENNPDLPEKLTFGKLISKVSSSNKNELYNPMI